MKSVTRIKTSINKYLLQSLGLGLSLCFMGMGCTPDNSPLGQEDTYRPIDLSELEGELTAEEPETIALNLFGQSESVEGNFSQEIEVIKQQGFERTLMLTQMNLPDDSVKGQRYRLEFEFDQSSGEWRLTQAQTQQSCYRSDDPNRWTVEPCP